MRTTTPVAIALIAIALTGCNSTVSRVQPGLIESAASGAVAFENDVVYVQIHSTFTLADGADPTSRCYQLRSPFRESYHSVVLSLSIAGDAPVAKVPVLALEVKSDELGLTCTQNSAPVYVLPFRSYQNRDIAINYNFHLVQNDRVTAEQIIKTISDISSSVSGLIPLVDATNQTFETASSVNRKIADFYQSIHSANTDITDGKIFRIDVGREHEDLLLFSIPLYDVQISRSKPAIKSEMGTLSVYANTLRSLLEQDGKFSEFDMAGLLNRKIVNEEGATQTIMEYLNSGDYSMTIGLLTTIQADDADTGFTKACNVFGGRLKRLGFNVYDRAAIIWATMMQHPGFNRTKEIQDNPCQKQLLPLIREMGISFQEVVVEYPTPAQMQHAVLNLESILRPRFSSGIVSTKGGRQSEQDKPIVYYLANEVDVLSSIPELRIQNVRNSDPWSIGRIFKALDVIDTSGECYYPESSGKGTLMRIYGFQVGDSIVWSEVTLTFGQETEDDSDRDTFETVVSRIELAPLDVMRHGRCVQQIGPELPDTSI